MNYIPFERSMLGKHEIIIWCPEEELWDQMKEDLDVEDVRWNGGMELFSEGVNAKIKSAFRIQKSRIVTCASLSFYEKEPCYQYCLFTVYQGGDEPIDVGDLI